MKNKSKSDLEIT